jgi:hypothetical protein
MAVSIAYNPGFIALDANGNPLAGGKVYTYAAGTTTPKATYTDSTGLVANANPVILDSAGYASIWVDGTYKFVITTSTDAPVRTIDNYTNDRGATGPSGSIPMVAAGGTVNAITANYTPDVTLSDTLVVGIVSAGANTSATPTLAVDGGTARTIVKQGNISLQNGDIGPAGSSHFLRYDLANTRWELMNPVGDVSGSWTPTPTSLLVSGTPTYTGFYRRVGRTVFCTLQVDSTVSTTSTAGTTYFSGLPFNAAANGTCDAVNSGSFVSLGVGKIQTGTDRVYPPSWSSLANVNLSFFYII